MAHRFGLFPFIATLSLIAIGYFSTLSAFLTPGDSGELIAVSAKLGVLHPPGYPLYTLLAWTFSKLPWGTMAVRISFLSMICQLGAAAFLFCFIKEWRQKTWIASSVTLLFCFSSLVWRFSTEAEVFALNNFFAALLIWLAWRLWLTPSRKKLLIWAGIFGLACSHHPTLLLFAGPLLGALIWQKKEALFHPQTLLMAGGCFALGLLPYGFLIVFAKSDQLISWGDLSSWEGFWIHVLRREYGVFQLAITSGDNPAFVSKLFIFAREISAQFFWIGLIPFVAALTILKENRFGQILLIGLAAYLVLFIGLTNLPLDHLLYIEVQSRFWILPYMLVCLFIAGGLDFFSRGPRLQQAAIQAVMILVILAQLIWSGQFHRTDLFEKVAHSILDHAEPNAIIFCREDIYCNGLRYLQVAENQRSDVKVVPQDLLWWPWMKDRLEKNIPDFHLPGQVLRFENPQGNEFDIKSLLKANIERFPLYVSELGEKQLALLENDFLIFPTGYVSVVKPKIFPLTLAQTQNWSADFLNLKMPLQKESKPGTWENYVIRSYYEFLIYLAHDTFKNAQGRTDWMLAGLQYLRRLELESDDYREQVIKEQALIYTQLSKKDPQYKNQALSYLDLFLNNVNKKGTPDNPEIALIRQIRANLSN